MNKDFFTAGCSDDNCGCLTHKDTLSFGKNNLETFKAGDSDCGCGCFSHKEILMA